MKPWSLHPVWFKRRDIAIRTGWKSLKKSGFFEVLHVEREEALDGNIEFFSVDERNHRLYPLSITFPLRILQ
jgi:hypothetical protein